jgi:hypothetical protein
MNGYSPDLDDWNGWLQFALDRGMIEMNGQQISWIHPLCSLLWRTFLRDTPAGNTISLKSVLVEEFTHQVAFIDGLPRHKAPILGWDANQATHETQNGISNCFSSLEICIEQGGKWPYLENILTIAIGYLETAGLFLSELEFYFLADRCECLVSILENPLSGNRQFKGTDSDLLLQDQTLPLAEISED